MELNRLTFAACVEFVVTNAVYPSGSAFRTVSAARLPSAPGLFSITTVMFVDARMLSARCLVTLSVALPGGNGTIRVIRWEGYGSADAPEKEAAKSIRVAGMSHIKLILNLISTRQLLGIGRHLPAKWHSLYSTSALETFNRIQIGHSRRDPFDHRECRVL